MLVTGLLVTKMSLLLFDVGSQRVLVEAKRRDQLCNENASMETFISSLNLHSSFTRIHV